MSAETQQGRSEEDLEHLFLDMTQIQSFHENPTIIREANGLIVTNVDGKHYMDGLSGSGRQHGHGSRAVIDAMMEQLRPLRFQHAHRHDE